MPDSDLTLAAVESMMDTQFPAGFARGRRSTTPADQLITESGDLTQTHVDSAVAHIESGEKLGVVNPPLKALRNTHHRLAQLLAAGMDETRAGRLCNYTGSTVSILKATPAFADLVDYYRRNIEAEFADFVTAAKELSMDMLGKLQEDLDAHPERFTPQVTLEAIKVLADRTGHAPVQKSVVVNVNANAADRLARARARVRSATIDGEATLVSD